jgi:hypothetical protein
MMYMEFDVQRRACVSVVTLSLALAAAADANAAMPGEHPPQVPHVDIAAQPTPPVAGATLAAGAFLHPPPLLGG